MAVTTATSNSTTSESVQEWFQRIGWIHCVNAYLIREHIRRNGQNGIRTSSPPSPTAN